MSIDNPSGAKRRRVERALRAVEPNALTGKDLHENRDASPSARIVLIKGINIKLVWDQDNNTQGVGKSKRRYPGTWGDLMT